MMHALTDAEIAALDEGSVRELYAAILAEERAEKYDQFRNLFPETGPLSYRNYPKHLEFFTAGASYSERCFMAANRVGKTIAGAYELTCHATGEYPTWWPGRRFNRPVRMWAAGDSNETTRDVIQKKLLGGIDWMGVTKTVDGSGMIPVDAIVKDEISWKAGVSDLIDTVKIRHKLGGYSTLGLKSYAQGRRSFQGTEQDVIWCDEEPPLEVYTEMLIRTMTTGGMTMLTYTPLEGLTGVVLSFLPDELRPPDDVIASLR